MIDSGWFLVDNCRKNLEELRSYVWKAIDAEPPKGWIQITLYIRSCYGEYWHFECRIMDISISISPNVYSSHKSYWADPTTLLPYVKGGIF